MGQIQNVPGPSQADFNALNDHMANLSGTVTRNETYIDNNNLTWSKSGNIVCVSGFFHTKAAVPVSSTMFTLPYTPIIKGGCIIATYNGDQVRAMVWSTDSKTVILQTASATTDKWFYTSFAYITSD